MVYAGAENKTSDEMQHSLGFSKNIHENLGSLSQKITGEILFSANRIWLENDVKLLNNYKNLLRKYYSSDAALVDFSKKPSDSRKIINDWVSKNTNNKIKNLIRKIEPNTRMILTNAVYFNAKWLSKFNKANTKKRPFKVPGSSENIEVDMMSKLEDLNYAEVDGTKIVKLPYESKNNNFAMLAVLPPLNSNEQDFLKNINQDLFSQWLKSLRNYKVDLWLPKFKTEKRYELKEIFKKLGVKIAFSNSADFSGMTKNESLKIDSVIHQSFIEIDEEKTEAAAATAVNMLRATAMPRRKPVIKEFHADRPFLYFIIDCDSETIIFMGKQSFK